MTIFNDIKSKTDIREVCELYVQFNNRGYASSPFTSDSNPSFTTCSQRQIASCFATDWHGDSISFVSEVENCSMLEAARIINDKLNLGLEFTKDPNYKYYHMVKSNLERWHSDLHEDTKSYALSRGLSQQIIDEELIGTKDGNYMTIAIKDSFGKVIGYNSRLVKGEGPKYINSEESVIFKKRKVLCNLHNVKKLIRSHNKVIVCEGQIDCLQALSKDIPAVCSLGVGFTIDHAKSLLPYTNNIILGFDDDIAGIEATKKAFTLLNSLDADCSVNVMSFNGKKDLGEALENNFSLHDEDFFSWLCKKEKDIREILKMMSKCVRRYKLAVYSNIVSTYTGLHQADIMYDVISMQGYNGSTESGDGHRRLNII